MYYIFKKQSQIQLLCSHSLFPHGAAQVLTSKQKFLMTRAGWHHPPEHCCRPWMYPDGSLPPGHPATNQKWFTEHSGDLYVLTWPPNSTDLNLVVHVWDVLISGGCRSQLKWGTPMAIIGLVFSLLDQGRQMLHQLTSYEIILRLTINSKLVQYLSPVVGMIPPLRCYMDDSVH